MGVTGLNLGTWEFHERLNRGSPFIDYFFLISPPDGFKNLTMLRLNVGVRSGLQDFGWSCSIFTKNVPAKVRVIRWLFGEEIGCDGRCFPATAQDDFWANLESTHAPRRKQSGQRALSQPDHHC